MRILVFNCGSSSLKFALFELGPDNAARMITRGELQAIGRSDGELFVEAGGATKKKPCPDCGYAAAATMVLDELAATAEARDVDAIAHRVVHGGAHIVAPTLVSDDILSDLRAASAFAPLHNPPALEAIRAAVTRLPGVRQVVVTDTAFHQTMPEVARTYPIPWKLAEQHGIRRYGFHGPGHAWMTQRYAELSGRPQSSLNAITLQLGAGCSAAAIRGGRSVETSMGLTPLEGLMMATRSGNLDPAIFPYLVESEQLAPRRLEHLLNHDSGLLGVSGLSGDMRELLKAEAAGNSRARLAITLFCYRVRQHIGAYLTIPEPATAVIFGGGIGERSPEIRGRICRQMESLGIRLNEDCNRRLTGGEGRFSAAGSPIDLWVIPLQEELFIARAAYGLVS
jgi:acetate kinase